MGSANQTFPAPPDSTPNRWAAAGPAPRPPDPGELVSISRITRKAKVALAMAAVVAAGGVALAVAAVAAPPALRWATAAVLVVVLAAAGLLAAHAGGHAWFVPLPAVALTAVWGFTASGHSPGAGWWLAALTATVTAGAMVLALTVLRQRQRDPMALLPQLRGAPGVAVTDLNPIGVVQVAGESWSAESVSGPLTAGAPVHALKARGVRLEVWSEAGTVPDAVVFDIKEDQP